MRTWRIANDRSAVTLVVSLLLLLGQAASGRQQAASSGGALPTDSPSEFEVAGDKPGHFDIVLKPGELFRVRVWQKDSEILLRLLDASGAELARMSSPREKDGLETLTFVASEAGSYTLEAGLLKKDAGRGKFTILREPPRAATATDRRRVKVERVFADGMVARDAEGQAETAVERFSEAAAGWRELGDEYMSWLSDLLVTRSRARATFIEARKILNKAELEPGGNMAKYRSASDMFQDARRLYHEGGETFNEGASLLGAALSEQGQNNWERTITFVEQALPIFDDSIKVDLLTNLVTYYLILHDTDSAIRRLREAHSIYAGFAQIENADAANNAENEAAVANYLGGLYLEIGDKGDAYKYLDESLQLRKKLGSRCGVPATLSNLGLYRYAVGEKARAKELLIDEALQQYPPGPECSFEKADTLLSIGKFYYDLGANDLALKYLADADVSIKQNIERLKLNIEAIMTVHDNLGVKSDLASQLAKNTSDRAMMLNYVGAATFASARDQEAAVSLLKLSPSKAAEAKAQALRLYEQSKTSYEEALRLYREISDKKYEAAVMTNIGVVLSALGRTDDAMKIFHNALEVGQGAEDKDAEGITLNNIGEFYASQGQHEKALGFFNQALPLLKTANDSEGEAITLADSMDAWGRAGNRRMAIFCGKQAINIFQELRGSARGLATEIQKDYLRRVRGSYQRLAGLLIEEGLYAQAAQILNLYQDQQFFDLDPKARVAQAAPTERERDWARRYNTGGDALAQLSSRIDEVKRQIGYRRPTAAQIAQLENLKAERAKAVGEFAEIIEGAEKEFARPPDEKGTDADVTPVTKMQDALDLIGKTPPSHKTFALYTLIGPDKFYVLLLKPGTVEAFSHPTNSADLNRLVQTVLSDLQNRAFPKKIRVSSSELYDIILRASSVGDGKSTLEAELESEKPDTLLWSLDGALSYLPVAALYDARKSQYLVEKYQNVVFTRADADRITRSTREWTTAIGFGKSTPAPPEIKCETPCDKPPCHNSLQALPLVPQEMSALSALVNGTVKLNEKFTRESLLKAKNIPLVHIASHFCFRPGDAEGSFLLLGNNEKFSLSEMNAYTDLYSGVDLLVLSACQTAAPEPSRMGKEIDSLAELSQRLGAASVMATLWNADEIGASRLMIRFYALHKLHKDWSKAELLRRAQLDLLKGREVARDTNLDHPYYWAPFVLYGSFR